MSQITLTYRSNHYSFGSIVESRSWKGDYRYGFNGMENDDEAKGQGNGVDFGARIYDGRLGRWLSLDRAYKIYPETSHYSYGLNSPIMMSDENGDWVKVKTTRYYDDNGSPKQKKWFQVFKKTTEIQREIIVGDIVFVNASYTYGKLGIQKKDRIPKELTDEQKQQIISNYSNALIQSFNAQDEKSNKTFKISLSIAGTPKFIENPEDLKGGEELVIIGDYKLLENEANGLTMGKSMMVIDLEKSLDPASRTAAHEFAHQRQSLRGVKSILEGVLNNSGEKEGGWLDHRQKGIFYHDEPKTNFKNIQTMRSGSFGIRKNSLKAKEVFETRDQYRENKSNKDE